MYRLATMAATAAFLVQPLQPAFANDDLLRQLSRLKSCQAVEQYVGNQIELSAVKIKSETLGGIQDLVIAGLGYVEAKNPRDVPAIWEKGVHKLQYEFRMRMMSSMIEQLISNYQRKVAQASWEEFVRDKTPDQLEQMLIAKYGKQSVEDVKHDLDNPDDLLIEFHSQAGDAIYNKAARENSDEGLRESAHKYLQQEARKRYFESRFIEEKELELVPSLREDNFAALFIQAMDTATKEQKDLQTVLGTYPAYVKLLDHYPTDQLSKLFEPWREIDIQLKDTFKLLEMERHHKVPLVFSSPAQFEQLNQLWIGTEQEASFDIKVSLNCIATSEMERVYGEQFAKFGKGDLELLISQGMLNGLGGSAESLFYFKVDEMKRK